MLTGLLLINRYRQGKVYPHVLPLDEVYIATANNLIQVFKESIHLKRQEVEEQLKVFHADKINPKVVQGLSKLLFDRSEFQTPEKVKPDQVRATIFDVSTKYWQSQNKKLDFRNHQTKILDLLPNQILPSDDDIDAWLYADIGANQKMINFKQISAEKLIHRYNISQVQGLLINAKKIILKLDTNDKSTLKKILQYLRFYGLMFSIENSDITIKIEISGPSSILEQSQSYGFDLAKFLPAILLLKCSWQLTANIYSKQRKRIFTMVLDQKSPYQSYLKTADNWVYDKITALVSRIKEKKKADYIASSASKIIPLSDNRFLLPDMKITNRATRKAYYIEWIRYQTNWKLDWLKSIHSEVPSNYIFAIKGKRVPMKLLADMYENQLMIYSNTLTAPSIIKQIEQF